MNRKFLIVLFSLFAVTLHADPKRIVSIAPGFTEILYALGCGPQIAGTTTYCDYPPEAKQTEKIGDAVNPNLEKIAALHPDIVFAGKWKWKVPENLRAMGINVVEIPDAQKISDILDRILLIGSKMNKQKEAEQIVSSMKSQLEAMHRQTAGKPKVRVYLELDSGNWTIGGTAYFDELLNYAGGENIFHDRQEPYLMVTTESIVSRNPQAILSLYRKKEDIRNSPAWAALPAVQNDFVFDKNSMNWDTVTRQSPRIVEGLKILRQLLEKVR